MKEKEPAGNGANMKTDNLVQRLLLITVVMLLTMTFYEFAKQALFPNISIWESHIITILLSTSIATVVGYFVLVKQNRLNKELLEINKKSETLRKDLEANLQHQKQLLSEVKKLSGMLPICASCKKIRDDDGYWNQIESYIKNHSEAEFSHSICPDCATKLYPDLTFTQKG